MTEIVTETVPCTNELPDPLTLAERVTWRVCGGGGGGLGVGVAPLTCRRERRGARCATRGGGTS